MNITEFRQKYPQYNDMDDKTLSEKFYTKYYSDMPRADFDAKFLVAAPAQAAPTEPQVSPLKRTAAAAAPYARTALEMGGMLAGGALAAPAGPVGALAGAGLGYAAGRQAAGALETYAGQRQGRSIPQGILEAAKDVPMGAAMEAGGAVVGLPIQKGIQALGKLAPRLYESVAKIPPRSVPKATREKAVETALEHEIPATQKGYHKLRGMIEDTNTQIAKVIDDAEEMSRNARGRNLKTGINEYEENMINTKDILSRLEGVKKWAQESYPDPTPINKMVDEFKYNVKRTRGAEISVKAAQKLKQGIYRRLTDAAYGEYSVPAKEIDKNFARGIKEELLNKFPVLQNLNAKDSALIGLQNILEKTVNRTRNWDLVGLTDLAGSGVGAVAGTLESGGDVKRGGTGAVLGLLLARGLRSPAVMSKIAFALNRASKMPASKVGPRALTYGTARASGNLDIPAEEIVSNVLNKVTPSAEAGEPLPASKRGIELYQADKWDEAIREWQKALKEEPKNAKEIIRWINVAKKEKQKAMEFYERQKNKAKNTTAKIPMKE